VTTESVGSGTGKRKIKKSKNKNIAKGKLSFLVRS
jgi:hypothetical protein